MPVIGFNLNSVAVISTIFFSGEVSSCADVRQPPATATARPSIRRRAVSGRRYRRLSRWSRYTSVSRLSHGPTASTATARAGAATAEPRTAAGTSGSVFQGRATSVTVVSRVSRRLPAEHDFVVSRTCRRLY